MLDTTAQTEPIAAGLRQLMEPGGVHELRVLNTRKGTVSGYFDDPGKMAAAAASWSGRAPGVYMTLNPVPPDLLARANNRCREYARTTTSDADIVRRRWWPLDFDPVRPAEISSTDEEHRAALERAVAAGRWLTQHVPRSALILCDSGNGAHLLVRVDLPNDDAARDLIRRCTEAVSLQFSDDAVAVDLTTYNAARIWKIPGTIAAKGDNVPGRPHRPARILQVVSDG